MSVGLVWAISLLSESMQRACSELRRAWGILLHREMSLTCFWPAAWGKARILGLRWSKLFYRPHQAPTPGKINLEPENGSSCVSPTKRDGILSIFSHDWFQCFAPLCSQRPSLMIDHQLKVAWTPRFSWTSRSVTFQFCFGHLRLDPEHVKALHRRSLESPVGGVPSFQRVDLLVPRNMGPQSYLFLGRSCPHFPENLKWGSRPSNTRPLVRVRTPHSRAPDLDPRHLAWFW